MFDHAWKNAFGADLHGRFHSAAADDDARHGSGSDIHPFAHGRDHDPTPTHDVADPAGAPESHPLALGQDAPAAMGDTADPAGAPESHPLALGQDNDTVIVGNGGSGGETGHGGNGGVFDGDVNVDTGNGFHFFVGGEPLTADGSSGFFAQLSGVVSGIFSSFFASGFQDNDTVIVGNGGDGGDGGAGGGGGDGGVFNGHVSVETGNDFNFYFGSEPTADESSGFFARLSGMVSGLFSSLFGDGFQDNDTVIIGNGGSGGDGSDGGDGGAFHGNVTVDTGNDFNFFFGSDSGAAEEPPGFFTELPTMVGDMFSSVFAGGFHDNDTVIVGNGGTGGGDGGIFNGDTTIDAGNHFNFLLA